MRAAVSAIAFLFSFVASTSAYSITTPNAEVGWTDQGPQNVTWNRVETDPLNFTIVLDNQSIQGFQMQVLAALVDGTAGSTTVNSHNGGWPTGSAFRVNFVKDNNNLNTILAQSNQFNITASSGSSTNNNPGSLSYSFGATVTPTGTGTQTGASATDATASSAILPTSGAASSYPVQTGLLALFSLIGFALA